MNFAERKIHFFILKRKDFLMEGNIKKIVFTALATMVGIWAYNKISERVSK